MQDAPLDRLRTRAHLLQNLLRPPARSAPTATERKEEEAWAQFQAQIDSASDLPALTQIEERMLEKAGATKQQRYHHLSQMQWPDEILNRHKPTGPTGDKYTQHDALVDYLIEYTTNNKPITAKLDALALDIRLHRQQRTPTPIPSRLRHAPIIILRKLLQGLFVFCCMVTLFAALSLPLPPWLGTLYQHLAKPSLSVPIFLLGAIAIASYIRGRLYPTHTHYTQASIAAWALEQEIWDAAGQLKTFTSLTHSEKAVIQQKLRDFATAYLTLHQTTHGAEDPLLRYCHTVKTGNAAIFPALYLLMPQYLEDYKQRVPRRSTKLQKYIDAAAFIVLLFSFTVLMDFVLVLTGLFSLSKLLGLTMHTPIVPTIALLALMESFKYLCRTWYRSHTHFIEAHTEEALADWYENDLLNTTRRLWQRLIAGRPGVTLMLIGYLGVIFGTAAMWIAMDFGEIANNMFIMGAAIWVGAAASGMWWITVVYPGHCCSGDNSVTLKTTTPAAKDTQRRFFVKFLLCSVGLLIAVALTSATHANFPLNPTEVWLLLGAMFVVQPLLEILYTTLRSRYPRHTAPAESTEEVERFLSDTLYTHPALPRGTDTELQQVAAAGNDGPASDGGGFSPSLQPPASATTP